MIEGIAATFVLIMAAIALRANKRLSRYDRLPMQWWLTGEVTWSAPRSVALAIVPAVGVATLSAFVLIAATWPPRAGQAGEVLPGLLVVGTIFVAIQTVHLWLIAATIKHPRD